MKFLTRATEKKVTHKQNNYDIAITARWKPDNSRSPTIVKGKTRLLNQSDTNEDIEVLVLTNLYQPFREDEPDEFVTLKSSIKPKRTGDLGKSKTKGVNRVSTRNKSEVSDKV